MRPITIETIPPFYRKYIQHIEEPNLIQALYKSGHAMMETVYKISEKNQNFRYAKDKWSVRELLCHLIDSERIFAYRALTIARRDLNKLPSFDEQDYAIQANAENRSLKQIANEMEHLRSSTVDLFESFTPEIYARKGIVNNSEISVMAIGFIIAGHETHHRNIICDRYISQR